MSTIKEASPIGRSERTRQILVEATVRRLRADGAFTAEQVASDAGVSVATIYNRFPDGRDGLLVAAFDRALDRVVAVSTRILIADHLLDHGLDSTLRSLVDGLVTVFAEEALVMRAALARLPENRLLREAYRRHETEARDASRQFIERGQAAGRITDGDLDELVDVVLVVGQGVNNPVLLGSTRRERLIDHLTEALVAVLAPERPTQ